MTTHSETMSVASAFSQAQELLASIVQRRVDKSLPDLELAYDMEKLQTMGVSQKTIANAFGLSVSWVWKRQTILRLAPEVLALMSAEVSAGERLTYSNAEVLTDLVDQPKLQIALAKEICQRRLSTTQARCLVKERADQEQILLASDTELLEGEFKKLFDYTQVADEQFQAMKVSPFRFRAMLDAYGVDDIRRLQGFLAGCAQNCATMAEMAQDYLSKE